jgi:hypothetical protein
MSPLKFRPTWRRVFASAAVDRFGGRSRYATQDSMPLALRVGSAPSGRLYLGMAVQISMRLLAGRSFTSNAIASPLDS